ncbi:MAG: hypothetical protein SAK29_32185 [Scytonema sp. PMC 1069.18]|nr:hypothetical protein [Scytonema sp. PMC 1069.18]MEC4883438.1 hypothetical protein [Scytonema sp. PMC 1070.18]
MISYATYSELQETLSGRTVVRPYTRSLLGRTTVPYEKAPPTPLHPVVVRANNRSPLHPTPYTPYFLKTASHFVNKPHNSFCFNLCRWLS